MFGTGTIIRDFRRGTTSNIFQPLVGRKSKKIPNPMQISWTLPKWRGQHFCTHKLTIIGRSVFRKGIQADIRAGDIVKIQQNSSAFRIFFLLKNVARISARNQRLAGMILTEEHLHVRADRQTSKEDTETFQQVQEKATIALGKWFARHNGRRCLNHAMPKIFPKIYG